MSVSTWVSPVQLMDSTVLGLSFSLEGDVPEEGLHGHLTLNASFGEPTMDAGLLCKKCQLEVVADWKSEGEEAIPLYSASCKVGIVVGVPTSAFPDNSSDADRERYVAANAISLSYGKIRAMIESITAESPVGKLMIPAIDPYAVLASLEETKPGKGE